jgi:hypothetical protein
MAIQIEDWLRFLAIGVLLMSLKIEVISVGTLRTTVALWLDV